MEGAACILPGDMKRIIRCTNNVALVLLSILLVPLPVQAEAPALPILIIELQTASATSGNDEFVELYNPNPYALQLAGWQLQYRASAKVGDGPADWRQLVNTLQCPENPELCRILPWGRLVVASQTYTTPGVLILGKTGMATESGQLRLTDTAGIVQDMVGYGQAVHAEGGKPAPKLAAGVSIKRRLSEDGYFIDTQVNGDDFAVGCIPTPPGMAGQASASTCENAPSEPEVPPTPDPPEQEAPSEDTGGNTDSAGYSPLIITEMLPDPGPPLQDQADEFIELYNPNTVPISLGGYTLQTGTGFRYKFTLEDTTIAPGGYVVIRSESSHLTLSNSGTAVRLVAPDGSVLDETPGYNGAKTGQSWMRDQGGWHWTAQPTPGAANVLVDPPVPVAAIAAAKPKKPRATANASTKATLPAAPKAGKKTEKAAATVTPETVAAAPPSNPHLWLLVPIGLLTVGYALYEYRQNITRFFTRLPGLKRREEPA